MQARMDKERHDAEMRKHQRYEELWNAELAVSNYLRPSFRPELLQTCWDIENLI